jgi:hypothetical protein
MSVLDRARTFGGREAYPGETSIVRLPAENAAAFVSAEFVLGNDVDFFECLYLIVGGGTEPSMELSRVRSDFESHEALLEFVEQASKLAVERAAIKAANAFFEIGVAALKPKPR